jgi:hypothetical protein
MANGWIARNVWPTVDLVERMFQPGTDVAASRGKVGHVLSRRRGCRNHLGEEFAQSR